ncbi:NAD(P)/FAD-dependent oxidoreductase [Candidatus Parcubacteria bacterium]|nr:MAG: NAD(P)/FAD-dependent oxidoreductase [Candidatus Parcubacteria bacterium]
MKNKGEDNQIYDLVVIGAGAAGLSAVEEAYRYTKNIAVIEKGLMGGECPNFACVPSKVLLASANAYYFARKELSNLGINARSVRIRFKKVLKRKENIVTKIVGLQGLKIKRRLARLGISVINGQAYFIDDHRLRVGNNIITAKKIIIASGNKFFVPPINGLKESGYITFRTIADKLPIFESIAIIGGGPAACEYAAFYSLLGKKVYVFEILDYILSGFDKEVSLLAESELKLLGATIQTGVKINKVNKNWRGKKIYFQDKEGKKNQIIVDEIMLAAGGKVDIDGLRLADAGIKIGDGKDVKVNQFLQTSKKHIFIAGDASGGLKLTPVAHFEGKIAAHNALARNKRFYRKAIVKNMSLVVFLRNEIASVGLTSEQASERGIKFKVYRFSTSSLARALADDSGGYVKVLAKEKSGIILGGSVMGPRAGEMIHELALAIQQNLKIHDFIGIMRAFPTYSESFSALRNYQH